MIRISQLVWFKIAMGIEIGDSHYYRKVKKIVIMRTNLDSQVKHTIYLISNLNSKLEFKIRYWIHNSSSYFSWNFLKKLNSNSKFSSE